MSSSPSYKVSISGDRNHLEETRELIHFVSRQHGLDVSEADVVEMAVSEACLNVLRHGKTKGDRAVFRLDIFVDERSIKAVIKDRGEAFEFDSIEPFDINQDFMQYKDGGLGIPLMKVLMDEVHYERKTRDINELTLVKYIRPKSRKRGKERDENQGKQ